MELVSVGLVSVFEPLYIAFGWAMRYLYGLFDNYGLVIIVFTIILRGLMIPLGVHQQKAMIRQQALQGELMEIQRLYPNDRAKQSELQMQLYQKHGASPLAGCLPALLQLIIIWPIFQIFRAPLVHIMQVSRENVTAIAQLLRTANLISDMDLKKRCSQQYPSDQCPEHQRLFSGPGCQSGPDADETVH
jgi:YidC/Oxa1 family membrane protein insertase